VHHAHDDVAPRLFELSGLQRLAEVGVLVEKTDRFLSMSLHCGTVPARGCARACAGIAQRMTDPDNIYPDPGMTASSDPVPPTPPGGPSPSPLPPQPDPAPPTPAPGPGAPPPSPGPQI
jgi:hypothetical protein